MRTSIHNFTSNIYREIAEVINSTIQVVYACCCCCCGMRMCPCGQYL